jgi:hypothetical protein
MAGGSKGAKRSRGSISRALPTLYLLVASAVALAVLPSVLRPPPDQAQSSAELSPDAPPEDEAETIIQSLQQAASRTAGASGGTAETVPVTTTSTILAAGRGRCFGDPPRQTESPYSPPCRAAFTGDNGGATYQNVSGDTIGIAFFHALGMPREKGPISDVPPPGESAEHRTARVIQRYFNERYELYGRRIQLIAIEDSPTTEAGERASAVQVATEEGAFAATHLGYPFCEEFARRGLVCFNGNGFRLREYDTYSPRFWSYQMSTDDVDRIAAEYTCKKLVGGNADFADPPQQGQPRRIAVAVESTYGNNFRTGADIASKMRDQCGFEPVVTVDFDAADPVDVAGALAQLRSADATTVVLEAGLLAVAQMWTAADNAGFNPEWAMFNSYGMDFNDAIRLVPADQVDQAFGMSGWELPQPFADTDCYRAYKSVDPTGEPDSNWCRLLWIGIEHLVNGIQEAGPNLTPETFRDGLYSMPTGEPRAPYAIGGDYGAGDHAFVDDLAEIWWDTECSDPDGGEPGCWRHTQNGMRFRPGELDDVVRVFSEGVTGYDARAGRPTG